MFDFLVQAGKDLVINIIQMTVGAVLAVVLIKLLKGKIEKFKNNNVTSCIVTFGVILLGVLLPLDTFGALPIFAAMIAVGIGIKRGAAFIVANAFFNMTVPFIDHAFIWRYGILRLALALIAGIVAYFILHLLKKQDDYIVNNKNTSILSYEPNGVADMVKHIGKSINLLMPYLLAGVLINTVFKNYILADILNFIFKNKATSFIPNAFSSLNVTNVLFLLALNIVTMIMSFIKLSALMAVFKIRGVIYYYVFYIALILVLSVSIFT